MVTLSRTLIILLLVFFAAGNTASLAAQTFLVGLGTPCPSGFVKTGSFPPSEEICDPIVSPQNIKGGATGQVINAAGYNPDWLHPDLFDPLPQYGGVGAQGFIAPQTQFVLFPASGKLPFPFDAKLNVDTPYVHRKSEKEVQRTGIPGVIPATDPKEDSGGLGDLTLRHRIRFGNENEIAQGVTTLGVKLPTGDQQQFENGVEQLPTGTGSVDFIVNQAFSLRRGPIRLVTSVGYRFNTTAAYSETFVDGRPARFRQRQGNTFTGMGGVEYFTPLRGLSVYAKVAGMITQRSRVRWTHEDFGDTILDEKRADGLKTIDVATGLAYSFRLPFRGRGFDLGFHAGVLIPAMTNFDQGVQNPTGRGVVFDFGFGGAF